MPAFIAVFQARRQRRGPRTTRPDVPRCALGRADTGRLRPHARVAARQAVHSLFVRHPNPNPNPVPKRFLSFPTTESCTLRPSQRRVTVSISPTRSGHEGPPNLGVRAALLFRFEEWRRGSAWPRAHPNPDRISVDSRRWTFIWSTGRTSSSDTITRYRRDTIPAVKRLQPCAASLVRCSRS